MVQTPSAFSPTSKSNWKPAISRFSNLCAVSVKVLNYGKAEAFAFGEITY
jgi:hypothetical protein